VGRASGWVPRLDLGGAEDDGLLSGHAGGHLFVAGCRTNQGKFSPAFDAVVLLSAPADVILSRVTSRTNNPYGHDPAEQEEILRYREQVEPQLRATATVEIDASASLTTVVDRVLAVADAMRDEASP
jgi:shikimate kinase